MLCDRHSYLLENLKYDNVVSKSIMIRLHKSTAVQEDKFLVYVIALRSQIGAAALFLTATGERVLVESLCEARVQPVCSNRL